MTVVTPSQARTVERASQATAVEQQRAIAEVQAAVVVAQQMPRNVTAAGEALAQSCSHLGLAERAFFRYSRGQGQITGPSIHLAVELARIWGNVQYGINELHRDDTGGSSEMIAWAWDVQTNTRASTSFIVPHARDARSGRQELTDLRDIYENNANNGARRLREMIFRIVPRWFLDDAIERCNATIARGDGKPLPQRITSTARAFADLGVDRDQLEAKIGRKADKWTEHDVAQLAVIGRSIRNGETTAAAEFGDVTTPAGATEAALKGQGQTAPAPASTPAPTPPPAAADAATPEAAEPGPGGVEAGAEPPPAGPADPPAGGDEPHGKRASSQKQRAKIKILAGERGLSGDDARDRYLQLLTEVACRPVTSSTELTWTEAGWVIQKLEALPTATEREPVAPEGTEPVDPGPAPSGPDAVAPSPGTEPGYPDDPDAALALDRLFTGAAQRHFTQAQCRLGLEQEYAQPVEDLTAEQIIHYMGRLALGTVKLPDVAE